MPSETTLTLSEKWRRYVSAAKTMGKRFIRVNVADIEEASRICAQFEQPPVAELRAKAEDVGRGIGVARGLEPAHRQLWSSDLRGYAHALVEVAEAREGGQNARDLYDTLSCGLGEHIRAREAAERKAETAWYYMQELGIDPDQDRLEAIGEIKDLKDGQAKAKRALADVVDLVGACDSADAIDNIEAIIAERDTTHEKLAEARAALKRVEGLLQRKLDHDSEIALDELSAALAGGESEVNG